MKNRKRALLLAAALTLSALGMSAAVIAQDATEGVVEALSEAEEAAGTDAADGESVYAPYYDQMEASVTSMLEQLSAMTDEQLNDIVEGTDAQSAAIAANWQSVKEELGVFNGSLEQSVTEDGDVVTVTTVADYDAVPENTTVTVSYVSDFKKNTTAVEWDIKYPMSKLIKEAGLNTLLGLGTVFVVLIFLSFVIANIHWIPDLVEKKQKKKAPAPAPAQAPAPAAPAATEAAEEELSDDEELVAVIAAAIAASEQTSPDGFVVRSIRKANRRSAV